MDILRISARWDGFPGAPGYSNFHFSTDGGFWDGGLLTPDAEVAAEAAKQRVTNAFLEIISILPDGSSVTIQDEAVILDSDTGEQLGFVEVDGGTVEALTSSDTMVGPAGAVINWRTNDYRFGRRVRGRTFLVPLNIRAYEGDGTLSTVGLDNTRAFANEIVNGDGAAQFGVWSRPRGGSGGVFASVVNYNVPDMAAVLRSRRD